MSKNVFLKIDDLLNEKDYYRIKDKELLDLIKNKNKNTIVLECSYSEFLIPVNTIFNYLVYLDTKDFFPCKVQLKYVSVFAKSLEVIPEGYKTICLFVCLDTDNHTFFTSSNYFDDSHKHVYFTTIKNYPYESDL